MTDASLAMSVLALSWGVSSLMMDTKGQNILTEMHIGNIGMLSCLEE